MISIRTKLSLWLTGLVVIATAIGIIFFESMLRQAFHDSIIARLQEDLQQVLLATHLDDGSFRIDENQLSSFYRPVYSGRYYQLDLPEQELRSRSLWDQRLEVEDLEKGETRAWQTKGPQNHDIQLLSIGLKSETSGLSATLTVAQDLSIGRKVFTEVYGTKFLVNLAMLLAMIMGIFLVLRQSFKPVNQMKDTLAKLREGEISSFDLTSIPLELQPLAKNYNELLAYSSKQIERSRNNLGNLSHGLKTPLAVMQQQVEALYLKEPESAEALQKQLDLVHKMIERKLAAARITGDMLPAAQMQLPKDIEDLAQTLNKVHRTKSIHCRFDIPAGITRLPMHREDGMELLGNLLDNAYKWASSEIRICISNHDQQLKLSIEDDGPGVETEQLAMLTHRGKRLDEATMGHGLGLSIVKDIAEQYKIELKFEHSQSLPGLKVTLLF
ncbi:MULTISPECIES: ATP-binding protein [Shewanella]|uniref:histidine kinase n=1 Tax=Shewanella fidelis TaxID=173509 RepID=A0AAW8NKZ5_9GAMM|nr:MULTISPECIES: ATP-binding protein [Shewanella]MDR8522409.1 ATP-binding protein [Shewanella fidelis]MDW4813057.1 ATP-binding protein [Shewanella fidelis]MDW4816684.1 ATP-binding protein [Shewanella fidelis]MDW4821064.1 ATP-binding protein [Shewanella fidelis]MDW4825401.1 ATP-binding protein [Shewanella fidelis]